MTTEKRLLRTIIPDNIIGDKKHYTYAHIMVGEQYPFYIGIGTKSKNSKSFLRANSKRGRNKTWLSRIEENQYYVIICNESDDYNLINEMEIEMIELVGREIDGGTLVNITKGGKGSIGYRHTDEYIEKLRIRVTGKNNPMFGKPISSEVRGILSKRFTGSGNNMFGRKTKKAKIIYKLDKDNNILEEFLSLRDAAKHEGISHSCIGESIKLGTKANGFKWRYKNGN